MPDVREIWFCRLCGLNFGDFCFNLQQPSNAFGKGSSLPHVGLKPDVIRNVSHQEKSVPALYVTVFVSSFSMKAVAGNWCLSSQQSVSDWESHKLVSEF